VSRGARNSLLLAHRRPGSRYLRIGHRGAAALAPENSLEAIEAALTAGVDGVELDVVRADRRLVCAHSLGERTAASPPLDQALAFFAERASPDALLVLDVKGVGFETELASALRGQTLLARTLVASFHASVLRALAAAEPDVRTALSYPFERLGALDRRVPDPVVRMGLAAMRRALPARIGRMLRSARADAAVLHHLVVSRAVIERCHSFGAPVLAWTVNDAAALARVVELGVDAVISGRPTPFAER
jgi:glycerophosphoryl diester phosphodiesterase